MKLSGNHGDATRGESNIAGKVDVLNRGGAGKDTSSFWCSRRFEWRRRLHGSWGRPDADAELLAVRLRLIQRSFREKREEDDEKKTSSHPGRAKNLERNDDFEDEGRHYKLHVAGLSLFALLSATDKQFFAISIVSRSWGCVCSAKKGAVVTFSSLQLHPRKNAHDVHDDRFLGSSTETLIAPGERTIHLDATR